MRAAPVRVLKQNPSVVRLVEAVSVAAAAVATPTAPTAKAIVVRAIRPRVPKRVMCDPSAGLRVPARWFVPDPHVRGNRVVTRCERSIGG